MRSHILAVGAALAASQVLAADAPARTTRLLASTTATSAGQPISLPQGPVQVTAVIAEIGPDTPTPVHKHPWPRYGYVLSGRLEVSNLETGQTQTFETGAFVIDPMGQWHRGRALGGKPVQLLIIDQAPPGQTNMVVKGGG